MCSDRLQVRVLTEAACCSYEPVRKIVYQLIDETAKYCETQPHQALVLLEALLSELCSHRPADFNHFT